MLLENKTHEELVKLASNTSDLEQMLLLKDSKSMNVRRALARNRNINERVLEHLLYDPVLNVSYMASINPRNKEKREFEADLRPCVLCQESEINLVCINCPNIKEYNQ